MSAGDFNPYYKWLGIPANELPANHYRLLGLSLFEPDPDVIQNAADRQMRHLRNYQRGERAAECQQLLSEIAIAKKTLLTADKRTAYDAQLKSQLSPAASAAPPVVPPGIPQATPIQPTAPAQAAPAAARTPAPSAAPSVGPTSSPRKTYHRSRGRQNTAIMIVVFIFLGGLAAAAVCAVTFFFVGSELFVNKPGPIVVELPPPPPPREENGPNKTNTNEQFTNAINQARTAVLAADVSAVNAAMKTASRNAKTDENRARLKGEKEILQAMIRFNAYIKQGAKRRVDKAPFTFQERVFQVFAVEDNTIRYSVSGERHERTVAELPPWDALAMAAAGGELSSSNLAAGAAGYALLHPAAATDEKLRSLGVSLQALVDDSPAFEPLAAEIKSKNWEDTPTMAIPEIESPDSDAPEPIPGLN